MGAAQREGAALSPAVMKYCFFGGIHTEIQLAARGTKESARLAWLFFGREKFILKTMMFREITTVLNERAYLRMVIRPVPDAVRLILG